MNRGEAMDKAVEIVEKWCAAPMKSNGYTVDGWKAPSLSEKADAAEKLANFLWEVDDVKVAGTGDSQIF